MANTYAQIPSDVIESKAYMTLPGKAPQVLAYIASKYRGDNNGDLCATYAELRAYGYHNKSITLAFSNLTGRGLLVRTRSGRGQGRKIGSLYALGWLPISTGVIRKLRGYGYNGQLKPVFGYLDWRAEKDVA